MRPPFYVLLGVLLVPTVGLVGDIVTDGKFKSTMSTGAPLQVASDDMVANLNADMVDGIEGTDLYTKAEVDALVADVLDSTATKEYYLTLGGADGAAAEGACADGFHMASLWEISDPSNLRYAYDRADATKGDDTEDGPPAGSPGWTRTGYYPTPSNVPGRANCNLWTTASNSAYGTTAELPSKWGDPAAGGLALVWGTPWASYAFPCDSPWQVWCIED